MARIGILTYYASINNGAFLQAYALQRFLSERYEKKATVEMIHYDSRRANDAYRSVTLTEEDELRYKKFINCRNKMSFSKGELITDDLLKVEDYIKGCNYDVVITGSDEVWKTDGFRGFPNAYWLHFDLGDTKKMAYAVSGRNSYGEMNEMQKQYAKEAMNEFCYIGTRDEITRRELLALNEIQIFRNCDPTILGCDFFTVSMNEREKIREKWNISKNKKVVLLTVTNKLLAAQLYRLMHTEFMVINTFATNGKWTDKNAYVISPFEWSELIAISDMVITDLFHGTLFSVIHHKRFISVDYKERNRGKIEAFLKENNMEDRCYKANEYLGMMGKIGMDIYTSRRQVMYENDYTNYEKVLCRERKKASSFLEALDNIVDELN